MAPVYRFDAGSGVLDRDYVHRLDPPAIAGEVWAVDLRIEVPLEKSSLVGREPIEAFAGEEGYVNFAKTLARRRGRPALSSAVHEVITNPMRRLKEESNERRHQARRVRDRVYKLMAAIQDGTRLDPKAVQLYVVLTGEGDDDDVKDWFGEWWDRASAVAQKHGLHLHGTAWLDAQRLDATLYDDLSEIRLPI